MGTQCLKKLLTHSLWKLSISKLVSSLNNNSKGSKSSEYSIAFGGKVKSHPLHKTDSSSSFNF